MIVAKSALVWCAGNVAEYSSVIYRIGDTQIRSFLTASALYAVYRPDYLLVLIPETLFEEDHPRQYRLLVSAKAGIEQNGIEYRLCVRRRREDGSEELRDVTVKDYSGEVLDFIAKLQQDDYTNLVVVPHPGSVDVLRLCTRKIEENGKFVMKVYIERIRRTFSGASAAHMLNLMYYHLAELVEKRGVQRLIVDLTHGTNIMIQLLLIASTLVKYGLELDVKLWVAPAIGTEIEFQDLTHLTDVILDLVRSIEGIRLLDERLLDLRSLERIGEKAGKILGPVYGSVRSATGKLRDIFWLIRSGQSAQIVKNVPELRQTLSKIEQNFPKLVDEYVHGTLGQELRDKDTPWLPLIHILYRKCKDLMAQIQGIEPLDTAIKLVEKLHASENYLPALLILRELVILTLLAINGYSQVSIKGPEWGEIENVLLLQDSAEKRAEKLLEILKNAREFITKEDLVELVKCFDRIVSVRNMLAHGMMPRDSILHLHSYTLWLNVNPLRRENIQKLIETLLHRIRALYLKFLNHKLSSLRELYRVLTEEELELIEKSYRESRKPE